MAKKKDEGTTEALSLRAFIKLLRAGKTLDDLDRLRVYNKERQPVVSVTEDNEMVIISCEQEKNQER